MSVQPAAPFQSASLYVGDLNNEVTEGLLYELFNKVGPVASIRVCRDAVTRNSLGYAYVNFHNVSDAERTLDTMNFTDIQGNPCRIMWSQRDPSLRKSGVGNIFVKNLAPTVDNKALFDTFSVFGNILSCKVACDDKGVSKGYGYVHYETAEAASEAINKLDGCQLDDFQVSVIPFQRRQDRVQEDNWTNLYVKMFPESWDEARMTSEFSAFGPLASVSIAKDAEGKSKKFGFVDYTNSADAKKAVDALNEKEYEDGETTFKLFVGKAQKKAERVRDMKAKADGLKQEKISKNLGLNLFVKNIDDSVTDELFRDTFAAFGTITSARIMKDEATGSKGFGFICYASPEEANRAVAELNGSILKGKPIVVTLHQRREVRRAQLAANYGRRVTFPQGQQQPMPYMMYPPTGQQYMGPPNQGMGGPQQRYQNAPYPPGGRGGNFPGQTGGRGGGGQPQYPTQGGRGGPGGAYPMPPYGMMPGRGGPMPPQMMMMGPGGRGGPTGGPDGGRGFRGGPGAGGRGGPSQVPGRGMPGQMMPQQGGRGGPPQQNVKFNAQARNQPGPQMMQPMPMGMPMPMMGMQQPPLMQVMPQPMSVAPRLATEPLDDQMLAAADPQTQKNMIGERLYPLIMEQQPNLAGKITGMLLEMDNAELLHLIESREALSSKIAEALDVLNKHTGEA